MKQNISRTLLQGFLVLLPFTIILIILIIVFKFIFNILMPISAMIDPGDDEPLWVMHLISLAILIVFVYMVGKAIQNRIGKAYFRQFESSYLKKIPLYSVIYDMVYQFAGIKKLPFSDVVLIDPFNTGVLMTGFITEYVNENLYTVFVPTAPNPTNGNIYHVPKDSIKFLDVTPQDAMRTIVGMGTGTSMLFEKDKKSDDTSQKPELDPKNVSIPGPSTQ